MNNRLLVFNNYLNGPTEKVVLIVCNIRRWRTISSTQDNRFWLAAILWAAVSFQGLIAACESSQIAGRTHSYRRVNLHSTGYITHVTITCIDNCPRLVLTNFTASTVRDAHFSSREWAESTCKRFTAFLYFWSMLTLIMILLL